MRALLALASVLQTQAPPPPEPPTVSYQEHRLIVRAELDEAATGTIEWQALPGAKGQRASLRHGKALSLSSGAQDLALDVADEAVHRITLHIGKDIHDLWASRGEWSAGPEDLDPESPRLPLKSGLVDLKDLMLARGHFVRVPKANSLLPLEIGRSLVRVEDPALPLADAKALVIIARGTLGPVKLVLTDRGPKNQPRYFDYPLLLGPSYRRYVVPLEAFAPREGSAKLKGIARVSVQSLEPLAGGAELEVDYLGLARRAPHVRWAKKGGERIDLLLRDAPADARVRTDDGGTGPRTDVAPNAQGIAVVSSAAARRFWACWGEAGGRGTCDPPDAPATAYALPVPPGLPVMIDDFSSGVPVSFDRRPTEVFTSSTSVRAEVSHSRGTLRLALTPKRRAEYAGYSVPLGEIPAWAKTIEVRIKGTAKPREILLGLRDAAGKEPKVRLGNYLHQLSAADWTDVRIPLIALQAAMAGFGGKKPLGPVQALTVTLAPEGLGRRAEIELDLLRFTAEALPLVVTSFDADPPGQTAFGGALKLSASGGITLSSTLAAGRHGQGLSVTVTPSDTPGQALVAFGFGKLDVRNYHALAFEVSGLGNDTHAELILADVKRRAKVPLAGRVEGTAPWATVRIPIADFGGRLDKSAVAQAFLAFDEKTARAERFVIDEVRLE